MVALMSKQETIKRDIIAQGGPVEMEMKDSPKSSRSASIDVDAIPTDIIPTNTQAAVGDVALLDDPFPCRINKFQRTECIGDERLSYEQRAFRFTRTSSRNNHFDGQHLPELTRRLAQGLLAYTHPKCTKMVPQVQERGRVQEPLAVGAPHRTPTCRGEGSSFAKVFSRYWQEKERRAQPDCVED